MMPVADHHPAIRKEGDGNQWCHRYVVCVRIRTQDIVSPEQASADKTCHLHQLLHVANLVMHDPEGVKLQSSVSHSPIQCPCASGPQQFSMNRVFRMVCQP